MLAGMFCVSRVYHSLSYIDALVSIQINGKKVPGMKYILLLLLPSIYSHSKNVYSLLSIIMYVVHVTVVFPPGFI